ncbi:unnamed protein product [Phytomonas sp. Hart1]|nr:unnamed protein product [Phytomonas sp. Hart1]|eukprot:CCW66245.1 unnamed protein product [Phytomonas sp. isolate Hart1]
MTVSDWIPATIPAVMTCSPPLGVLHAFPAATVEHLMGDHQRQIERLLHALSQRLQAWQHKVSACRRDLDSTHPHPSQSFGGMKQRGLGEREGFIFAQIDVGVYGMLAALVKMESVLQEGVLALRQDFYRCRGNSFAAALSQFIQRESEEERGQFIRLAASTEIGVDLGAVNVNAEAVIHGLDGSTYRLLEALEKLGDFVLRMWEHCKRVYCTEESLILLASEN